MRKRSREEFILLLAPACYLAAAVATVLIVCRNGLYPSGSDILYHLYRGDAVYSAWREGSLWILWDPLLYNGVELLRQVSPGPAYAAALAIWLAGGDVLNGYLILLGLLCFFSGVSWLWVGRRCGRPCLAALLGLIWFFLPFHLYMLFSVGDLGHSISMLFLPPLVCLLYQYILAPKWTRLPGISACFAAMALCSVSCAGVLLWGLFLFILLCAALTRRWRTGMEALLAVLLGLAAAGLWLCPALLGGNGVTLTAQRVSSLWAALNPLACLNSEGASPYFGAAALALAVLGSLFSQKRSLPGFWSGLLLLLCAAVPVSLLPGSSYWIKLASLALCLILFAFLSWPSLRRPLAALLCLLLCLDVLPALQLIRGSQSGELAADRLDALQAYTLIDKAQEQGLQRLALLDGGALEGAGAFLTAGWNGSLAACFGWRWETAGTAENISHIEQALSDSCYLYVFDRCMELGSDGVLIALDQAADLAGLDQAAQTVGYTAAASNDAYRLYTLATEGSWGLLTQYPAIAIGDSAALAATWFPALEEGSSSNLSDYSLQQLSEYQTVYLSGFTYDDQESAEALLLQLSQAGTRVVVDANGLSSDRLGQRTFLGVAIHSVSISASFLSLSTAEAALPIDLYDQQTPWRTVYLEGLEELWGWIGEDELTMEICGTAENENLVLIGLNLPYYYELTGDEAVGQLLCRLLGLSQDQLPQRTLVPLELAYGRDSITVTSPADGVNTTLAFHDSFQSAGAIAQWNHLLVVPQGTTVISLSYPYLRLGLAVTAAGLLLSAALCLSVRRRDRNGKPITGCRASL